MRTFVLAVTGVMRHRLGAMSLFASAIAVILSCSSLITAPPIDSVVVTLTTSQPRVGQTLAASATLRDATGLIVSGRAVTWSLSNPAVASIEGEGTSVQITTIAAGTTEVTATSGGQSGGAALTVDPAAAAPVASVGVSLAASTLNPGQTTQGTATPRDASNNALTGRAISWSSNNTSVASVSTSGLVTAVAVGTAQITATSEGQSGSASITVSSSAPAAVASVSVSLGSSSRNIGQTTQATATTRDANNNVLTGRAIAWGSSNTSIATVSASGLVTAVAAGSAQITATSEGQSGNATFTVNAAPPPPAPVAAVTVSLAASSLIPGQTTQATATMRDANNNVLTGRVVSWSSSNTGIATVSSSGVVTGIAVGGGVQITATSEGVAGSATVGVTAAPPPPPPGSSNEPTGMTLITERLFNALGEGGWYDENSSELTIVADATAPKSPANIIQQRFRAGFGGGASPTISEKGLGSRYTTLYISYWMKLSSNWYGHPSSNVNKQMHVWINGGNHVFTLAQGSGNGALRAEIWLQGTAGSPAQRNLLPNAGSNGTIVRGQWHRWEIVLKANTAGTANGSVEWWLDGVKVGNYTDVQFEPGLSTWELIQWSPTWGGTGSTVPADMYESLDHLYISGKN